MSLNQIPLAQPESVNEIDQIKSQISEHIDKMREFESARRLRQYKVDGKNVEFDEKKDLAYKEGQAAQEIQIDDKVACLMSVESGGERVEFSEDKINKRGVELFFEKDIANIDTIHDIIELIAKRQTGLTSSDGHVYTTEKLIDILSKVDSGLLDVNFVTRTANLRN